MKALFVNGMPLIRPRPPRRHSVANLSFGDVEANQARELVRIRQEEVLFSAPEADVDDDVAFTDLGRLKDLDAKLLLALLVGLLARDRVPVVQELAVLLEQFQGALEQVVLSRDGTRERRGEVNHGRSDTGRHSSAHCRERPLTQHDQIQGTICLIRYLGFVAADSVSGSTVL